MKITDIIAREIFDSRGWPTIQCEMQLEHKHIVLASVPAGASVGYEEAVELRDRTSRLHGKGVLKAIENIENIIAPHFIGKEPHAIDMDLKMIELDGTPNKSKLGANSMLAVSMALYRAESLNENIELFEFIAYVMGNDTVTLPFPMFNLINGGAHADNNLMIQEFMIVPVGASTFRSALETGILVHHELKKLIQSLNMSTAVGDEGGFSVGFTDSKQALDLLIQAIDNISKKHAISSVIALDVAANNFYDTSTKLYNWHGDQLTTQEFINYYKYLIDQYPIYSIEDGLSELDYKGWITMMNQLSQKVKIVGDDILATNIHKIAQAAEDKVVNSVIIKPNQVGTVTETLQSIKLAKERNLSTIVSHRSGETADTFISDLAVGASADHIKAGGLSRSERLAKYNRLLAIEDYLSLTLLDS